MMYNYLKIFRIVSTNQQFRWTRFVNAALAAVVLTLASCSSSAPRQNPNMVADIDPIELGTISFETDKVFSNGVNEETAQVFFDPRINAVYLAFRHQMVPYRQYWDKVGRDAFIAAYNQYNADFENQVLIDRDSKTRDIYGGFEGMTVWSALNVALAEKYTAYPKMRLGYSFKQVSDRLSPFFSVLQLDDADTSQPNKSVASLRIRTYYTRAQAEALISYFDDDYLLREVRDHTMNLYNDNLTGDAYTEYGSN